MLPIVVRSRILGRNSLACVCTLVSARPGQGNFRTTFGQLLDNYTQKLRIDRNTSLEGAEPRRRFVTRTQA